LVAKDLLFDHAAWDEYLTPDAGVGQWGRCRYGCDQTEQHDSQVVAQRFVMCHGMRRESDVMRHVLFRVLFRVTCHVTPGGWGHVAARQNVGFRQLVVRSNVAAALCQWNQH
jgi:hypothetical protein